MITNIEEVNEENINQFVGGLNKSKGALKTGFGTIDKTIGEYEKERYSLSKQDRQQEKQHLH